MIKLLLLILILATMVACSRSSKYAYPYPHDPSLDRTEGKFTGGPMFLDKSKEAMALLSETMPAEMIWFNKVQVIKEEASPCGGAVACYCCGTIAMQYNESTRIFAMRLIHEAAHAAGADECDAIRAHVEFLKRIDAKDLLRQWGLPLSCE